jgi:hypothetical protein
MRPMHYQVYLQRQIIVTERIELHGLWEKNMMFLKPLPIFLLHPEFWTEYFCKDEALYGSAVGFLLSYISLIGRPSDLAIAKKLHLISLEITWERWNKFAKAFTGSVNYRSLQGVNPRYQYGELRLSRVNWVYRLSSATRGWNTLIRGYRFGYNHYSSFLYENFAWIVAAFAYLTITLTAMQVGLATNQLQGSKSFNRASYGLTVFSILSPLVVVCIAIGLLALLLFFNWHATIAHRRHVFEYRNKS